MIQRIECQMIMKKIKKTMSNIKYFFNASKNLVIGFFHNIKTIENQLIHNNVITPLYQCYVVVITINKIYIGMRVANAAHPIKKNHKFTS